MTYAEKLKDPRWQKKRLEILERDKWTCQQCQSKEKTLTIHHKYYGSRIGKKLEPWEAQERWLITLCEECHSKRQDSEDSLMYAASFLKGFELYCLSEVIHKILTSSHKEKFLRALSSFVLVDGERKEAE